LSKAKQFIEFEIEYLQGKREENRLEDDGK
jgi:hypothetical protein